MTEASLAGLITWLWQGCTLALLAALIVRGVRVIVGDGAASTRYLIWWAVLVSIVVLPLAGRVSLRTTAWPASGTSTLSALSGTSAAAGTSALSGAADRAMRHVNVEAAAIQTTPGTAVTTEPLLTLPPVPGWLVAACLGGWLAFVALRLGRVARAFHHLARLRRRCRPLAPARQRRLGRWTAQQARGRRTRLAVSDDITVPALFGFTRPLVIIPRPLLDTLTDDELDHVVLHEHAHAQRWDDWALLLQSCVSAVIGLHPAVWTATRALGRERELACDDRVIAQGGSPRSYALSMTKVAEVALGALPPALAPGMHTTRGALTHRVERLLGQTPESVGRRPSILVLAGTASAMVTVIALLGTLPPLASTEPPGLPRVAPRFDPAPAIPALVPTRMTSRPRVVAARPIVGATPPARPAVAWPEATNSKSDPAESVPTVQTSAIRPGPEAAPGTPHLPPLRSTPLTPRTPPGPLTSRPVAPSLMTATVNLPSPRRRPYLWRQLADGGTALGSKTAQAGQSTGDAFKRFGLTVGRVFTGGP